MLDIVLLGFEEVGGIVVDGDGGDFVALFDFIDDVLAVGDLSENRVFSIEMRSRIVSDEELGSVGAGAGVRHGENAG